MRLTNSHTHHTSLIVGVDDVNMKVIYNQIITMKKDT